MSAAVAGEEPVALPHQHQRKPVTERPVLEVGHRLEGVHLLDGVAATSTSSTGSARKAAQRQRSGAVLQSSPAEAVARPSATGSGDAVSVQGSTK